MKLESIFIEGSMYYQWVVLGTEYPFMNTVGDLFSEYKDIDREKSKLKEQYGL